MPRLSMAEPIASTRNCDSGIIRTAVAKQRNQGDSGTAGDDDKLAFPPTLAWEVGATA